MPDVEKVIKGLEHEVARTESEWLDCVEVALLRDALALLKAQEPETMDAPKPDSDIGCWYDITHNYTLEQVVSALKEQEPPTSEFISSAIECLLHPQDADDSDMAKAIDTAVRAMRLLTAQVPRVMTLEEVKKKVGSGEYVFTECEKEGQWMRYGDARLSVDQGDSCRIAFLISRRGDDPYVRWWMIYYKNYNKTWRCWTSRPDEKRRAETPWS